MSTVSTASGIFAGIFSREQGQRFLQILVALGAKGFEGLYKRCENDLSGSYYQMGLRRANQWSEETLREDVDSIKRYFPDLEDIFESCFVSYVEDTFRKKKVSIYAPSVLEFVSAFYEALGKHDALVTGDFFARRDMILQRIACMDAARQGMYALSSSKHVRVELASEVSSARAYKSSSSRPPPPSSDVAAPAPPPPPTPPRSPPRRTTATPPPTRPATPPRSPPRRPVATPPPTRPATPPPPATPQHRLPEDDVHPNDSVSQIGSVASFRPPDVRLPRDLVDDQKSSVSMYRRSNEAPRREDPPPRRHEDPPLSVRDDPPPRREDLPPPDREDRHHHNDVRRGDRRDDDRHNDAARREDRRGDRHDFVPRSHSPAPSATKGASVGFGLKNHPRSPQ